MAQVSNPINSRLRVLAAEIAQATGRMATFDQSPDVDRMVTGNTPGRPARWMEVGHLGVGMAAPTFQNFGTVALESLPGLGTTASVSLPLAAAPAQV